MHLGGDPGARSARCVPAPVQLPKSCAASEAGVVQRPAEVLTRSPFSRTGNHGRTRGDSAVCALLHDASPFLDGDGLSCRDRTQTVHLSAGPPDLYFIGLLALSETSRQHKLAGRKITPAAMDCQQLAF